jgi:hypothetical protein
MYDSREDVWIDCPPMSLKRGSLAGATIGDRIFALGGGNGHMHYSDVECYDAHLGMWISSTSMLNKVCLLNFLATSVKKYRKDEQNKRN